MCIKVTPPIEGKEQLFRVNEAIEVSRRNWYLPLQPRSWKEDNAEQVQLVVRTENFDTWYTELRGPVVQSPIKANPGILEILIIYLPLKEDFSQDES